MERPRKMELLHTPKAEILKLMRENSLTIDEVFFLFESKKVVAGDIRMNAPAICDKMLGMFLNQHTTVPPMTA